MDCLVMLLISTVPCDLILSCSWRICSICSKYTQLNVYVILAWMGRVSDNSENIQLCTASHSNQPTYQTQKQQLAFVCFNRACLDSLFPRRSDRLTFKFCSQASSVFCLHFRFMFIFYLNLLHYFGSLISQIMFDCPFGLFIISFNTTNKILDPGWLVLILIANE